MTDYKELIDELTELLSLNDENLCSLIVKNNDLQNGLVQAAEAIEQLVKERNAAVDDLKEAMPCRACKYLAVLEYCKNCYSENHWEWRGVQEAEHETH